MRIEFRNGYPVFEPFAYPAQTSESSNLPRAAIPVSGLTGFSGPDNTLANDAYRELIGDPDWEQPDTHTWHHHQDCNTMVLVPKNIHGEPTLRHEGGASKIRNGTC